MDNKNVYASISGGKDSVAMGLYFLEKNIEFKPVFIDTGWEKESTYDYINDILSPLFGDFTIIRNEEYFKEEHSAPGGMEQLIEEQKIFPTGGIRFCTRLLKIVPIQNFLALERVKIGSKPTNAVGIRAEESIKRSEMTEYEEQDESIIWRPLINWTLDEVVSIHKKHSVPPNPLYLKGALRVGCYPCIFSRKEEIKNLARTDPGRIEKIKNLEEHISEIRGGESHFFKGGNINEVVDWATNKTGYLFDEDSFDSDVGCMRWGVCE